MKKIICYLRTIKEWQVFFNALFNFGAIYIAHDYLEVSNKFNKRKRRMEQKLVCQTCGDVDMGYKTFKN